MTDDFHGVREWDVFMASMSKVFPDRPMVDIPKTDSIFHVLYDVADKMQVPGIQYWDSGSISEKGGVEPHWRGIYDDHGRLMMAICHNQDNGDAWELYKLSTDRAESDNLAAKEPERVKAMAERWEKLEAEFVAQAGPKPEGQGKKGKGRKK